MQPHRIEIHEDPHDLARAIEMEPATFMTTDRLTALAQRMRRLADDLDSAVQYGDEQDEQLNTVEEQRDKAIEDAETVQLECDQMQDERDEAQEECDRLQNEYDALRELFDTCTS